MERFTVKASINGNLSHRPTFQINETSPSYTTSIQSKPPLTDASFSSYLPPQNPKQIPEDMEISIFDAERYFNETQDQTKKKKIPTIMNLDRTIERCDVSTINRLSSVSSVDGYGRNYRTGSFNATPTVSSEASWNSQSGLLSNPPGSIAISMRDLPLNDHKKGSNTNKWFFRRKCPCSGKKSVDVNEKVSEPKSSNPSLNHKKQGFKTGEEVVVVDNKAAKEKTEKSLEIEERTKMKIVPGNWAKDQEISSAGELSPENCFPAEISRCIIPSNRSFGDAGGFSFPILNPPAASGSAGKLLRNAGNRPEEPARDSLEVFRPLDDTPTRKSTDFQRRLLISSFPGDSDRRSFTFPTSPKTRATAIDDDVASDSSSDLFELESFSTQTTSYPMYRRGDSLDEISGRLVGTGAGILHFRRSLEENASSIAPSECYEPSEVSVDWSVTTAEGFDRGSVTNYSTAASEYEDVRFMHQDSGRVVAGAGGGGAGKRRSNGLLSCRCEKAVNVAPHPVKCASVSEQRKVSPPKFPEELGQIPAAARLANITSAHGMRVSEKPPLARSNSARMSRLLATR